MADNNEFYNRTIKSDIGLGFTKRRNMPVHVTITLIKNPVDCDTFKTVGPLFKQILASLFNLR